MLIKDEETGNIILGDTFGDGKTRDGFPSKRSQYMFANPPFGVEWKDQQKVVTKEHEELGFGGRFCAGLPAINDGSLLFLQHMMSKMHPAPDKGGEGSTARPCSAAMPVPVHPTSGAGSSRMTGSTSSSPCPTKLFYNTGIFTYVWLVTNRKAQERRGKVQLIDGTRFFQKMKKSLNNKRNELTEAHIARLTQIYGNFRYGETERVAIDGTSEERVVSRIFENREFGFLKVTVERPAALYAAVAVAIFAVWISPWLLAGLVLAFVVWWTKFRRRPDPQEVAP
jgi:type I restriction enzyme M protein